MDNVMFALFVLAVFGIAGFGVYLLPWGDRELEETVNEVKDWFINWWRN